MTAKELLMIGAPLTTSQLVTLVELGSAHGVRCRLARVGAKPMESAGAASLWSREDYERAFPVLAAIRGAA